MFDKLLTDETLTFDKSSKSENTSKRNLGVQKLKSALRE